MTRLTSSALLLLVAAACTPADENAAGTPAAETAAPPIATAVDTEAEAEAIRELNDQFIAAFEQGDANAVAALFTQEGRFMAPNAEAAQGTEAIRAFQQEMLALPGVSLNFESTEIEVSGDGQMAYDVGTYEFALDGPDGPVEDSGKYLTVWEKVDGQWKIAADMFNTSLPAPQP